MKRHITILAIIVAASPVVLAGQESAHAGHDEMGAREPVYGQLDFPTAASPASHAAFVRGMLLLHNFHYPKAQAAFREAETLDPADVMGYWGEAMTYTHPVWDEQDTAAAAAVLRRLAPTREQRLALARNPREGRWLETAEVLYAPSGSKARRDTLFSAAMKSLHESDTSDVEAATLYALSLLGLNQGQRDIATYGRAYQILAPIFASHPKHPGAAHYLIHAVDDPDHAQMGLAAARAYSGIAPSAGHALHMTSHIFLALGNWDDVVKANFMAQKAGQPGVLSGHGTHWLHYGLLQQGRYREADHWLDSIAHQAQSGPGALRSDSWDAVGLMAAANLSDTRRWNGLASSIVVDTTTFGTGDLLDFAATEFGPAFDAIERGDEKKVSAILSTMEARRNRVAGDPLLTTDRGMTEVMEKTLRGLNQAKHGDNAGAIVTLRNAADQEAALPVFFGPPLVAKPPREAAGEVLLAAGRAAEARSEFLLALARTPRRPSVVLGLARTERALGNSDASRSRYRELLEIWHYADADLPELKEAKAGAK